MKKMSDEFVIAIGLLLISFFIFQGAVMPDIIRNNYTALTIDSTLTNPYKITPSKDHGGVFNFKYKFSKTSAFAKGVTPFDIAIEQFNDKAASVGLVAGQNDFGRIRDAWNYPIKENAFMSLKKSSKVSGAKSDDSPDVLGLVNCRANTSVTGYFKAYFEDVALNNNIGYADPILGQARRDKACLALQDIGTLISLDQTTVTPDIIFMADTGDLPTGALAAASSYFGYYSSTPDNGSLHKHIISRIDPTPAPGMFDAFIITNFNNVGWDVDSTLSESTHSFYTVIYHEILHAMGFRALLPAVITSTNDQHTFDTFDSFNYKDQTLINQFINPTTSNLEAPVGAPSAWFVTNNVVYRGVKNLSNATPDWIRSVFSPSSWQQGSSLSHFDMVRDTPEVYIMNPSIPTNTERSINNGEKEVLCHLGYQVVGMTGCEGATPFAGDDMVVLGDTPLCVSPFQNDLAFDGQIIGNSLQEISTDDADVITFYSGVNCSGATISSMNGAKSFIFSPAPNLESRILAYRIKDTVSNRLSQYAHISMIACDIPSNEYICNGGFELGQITSMSSVQVIGCPTAFPFICSIDGSPDIYNRDMNFYNNWLGAGVSDTHSGAPNDRYLFGSGAYLNYYEGLHIFDFERPIIKTISPLLPGNYTLSWYGIFSIHTNIYSNPVMNFYITGEPAPTFLSGTNEHYSPAPGDIHLIKEVTPVSISDYDDPANWELNTINFTVPDNGIAYRYVLFEPEVTAIQNGTGMGLRIATDDVSLIRTNPSSGASVKGKVYNDINQDGNIDTNEGGLDAIQIGLFNQNEGTPIQITSTQDIPNLGKYEFAGVADGTYNIAIYDESVYPLITEPGWDNIIPGYSHVRSVTVLNGQMIENNNFGVTLSDGILDSDILIRKYIVDSTLSLIDRNITFRIDAFNNGPDGATNINISDLAPSPLSYYTHATSGPNSYNQSSGVWHIPSLNSGVGASILITFKVPKSACGVITNTTDLISLDQNDNNIVNNHSFAPIKLKPCKTQGTTLDSNSTPG